MSGMFRPVGPLPASAYWLRRVLVAGLVLVLGWVLIAWLLPDADPGKKESTGGTSNVASTPEPTTNSEPNQQVTDERPTEDPADEKADEKADERADEPADTKQEKPSKADPRDLGELPACPDDVLTAEVAPEKDPSRAGEPLPLKLTFTSDASESCKIPVSPDTVDLSVVSGADPIWNTEECDSVIPTGPLSMNPGEPRTITVTWPGRRSAEGCPDDADAALAGYYAVELSLNDTVLDEGRFRLF